MSTKPNFATAADQPDPAVAAVANSSNQFAIDLFAKLGAADKGNLFFSPQSISTALAMTYTGARGDTAAQMASVLHLNLPADNLASAEAAMIKQLNEGGKEGQYQLSVANRLWGQQGYSFLDGFLKTLREDYRADLEQLDFSTNPEAARQTINTWVEHATNDKIKDLIPHGGVDESTKLVLTNAIYFKGDWENPFKANATKSAPFSLTDEKKADVPLMYQKEHCRFAMAPLAGEESLKVLELPYKGYKLSMVVLLPEKVEGLAALEKELTAEKLKQWTDKCDSQEVRIWLPKTKMSAEFELAKTLSALGMASAFDASNADFSGMDGKRDLFISAVVHKAFVDVNEEGTEAAAATGTAMAMAMANPKPPQEFRADHPFVFFIRDNQTGCILFMGRVTDPR